MERLILTANSSHAERDGTKTNMTFTVARNQTGAPVLGLKTDNVSVAFISQPAEITFMEDYGFGFYYVDVEWSGILPQGWTVSGERTIMLMVREFDEPAGGSGKGEVISSGRMVLPLFID